MIKIHELKRILETSEDCNLTQLDIFHMFNENAIILIDLEHYLDHLLSTRFHAPGFGEINIIIPSHFDGLMTLNDMSHMEDWIMSKFGDGSQLSINFHADLREARIESDIHEQDREILFLNNFLNIFQVLKNFLVYKREFDELFMRWLDTVPIHQ